jgi:tetratricopeptide (TPR) repeat protein
LLKEKQGKYAEAEELTKRAIAISEKSLGPDHAEVASKLAYLASIYIKEGKDAQAEPLYKRALTALERSLGPKDPQVVEIRTKYDALVRKKQSSHKRSGLVPLALRA